MNSTGAAAIRVLLIGLILSLAPAWAERINVDALSLAVPKDYTVFREGKLTALSCSRDWVINITPLDFKGDPDRERRRLEKVEGGESTFSPLEVPGSKSAHIYYRKDPQPGRIWGGLRVFCPGRIYSLTVRGRPSRKGRVPTRAKAVLEELASSMRVSGP